MKNQIYIGLFILLLCACNVSSDDNSEKLTNEKESVDTTKLTEELFSPSTEVTFESLDGLLISATIYTSIKDTLAETILLCHQAGYNRHEYDEIGLKLAEQGFNCIAIDQRAGGILNDYVNQTADRAIDSNVGLSYVDAEQDIIAGINYAYTKYKKPVILWGSSYSAGLALHIGKTNDKLKAVVAFSPGDYFEDKKPALLTIMKNYSIPFFITSAENEAAAITTFLNDQVLDDEHIHFIPEKQGKHGSKALWTTHENNAEYWNALTSFLEKF